MVYPTTTSSENSLDENKIQVLSALSHEIEDSKHKNSDYSDKKYKEFAFASYVMQLIDLLPHSDEDSKSTEDIYQKNRLVEIIEFVLVFLNIEKSSFYDLLKEDICIHGSKHLLQVADPYEKMKISYDANVPNRKKFIEIVCDRNVKAIRSMFDIKNPGLGSSDYQKLKNGYSIDSSVCNIISGVINQVYDNFDLPLVVMSSQTEEEWDEKKLENEIISCIRLYLEQTNTQIDSMTADIINNAQKASLKAAIEQIIINSANLSYDIYYGRLDSYSAGFMKKSIFHKATSNGIARAIKSHMHIDTAQSNKKSKRFLFFPYRSPSPACVSTRLKPYSTLVFSRSKFNTDSADTEYINPAYHHDLLLSTFKILPFPLLNVLGKCNVEEKSVPSIAKKKTKISDVEKFHSLEENSETHAMIKKDKKLIDYIRSVHTSIIIFSLFMALILFALALRLISLFLY